MFTPKFYVYRHIRNDTGRPFYVGKGTGSRWRNLSQRNKYHKCIQKAVSVTCSIVKYFKTEAEAFAFEETLISAYKKFGMAEANFSTGGRASTAGMKHSETSRLKIGAASKARGGGKLGGLKLKNKKRPAEVIEKIRRAHTGSKRSLEACLRIAKGKLGTTQKGRREIIDSLGNTFDSIKRAAEFHGVGPTLVSNVVNGWAESLRNGISFKALNRGEK